MGQSPDSSPTVGRPGHSLQMPALHRSWMIFHLLLLMTGHLAHSYPQAMDERLQDPEETDTSFYYPQAYPQYLYPAIAQLVNSAPQRNLDFHLTNPIMAKRGTWKRKPRYVSNYADAVFRGLG